MKNETPVITYALYGSLALLLILASTLVYGYREYTALQKAHEVLKSELSDTKTALSSKEIETATLGMTLEEIKQAYALSEENGSDLLDKLNDEKDRNDAFEDQIDDITGTVGQLDKLSKTDPELLQKYSKVYFLNEHYTPEKVSAIPKTFTFKTDEPEYISAKILPYLNDLLDDALENDIHLLVVSGYRSFDEQKGLKTAYTTQYGSGANAFSADQGYSEHQLGTTVDFTTKETGGALTGFETTEAYTWLQKNAHRYGFVLSYPKDNAFYVFEPWHWRFVGEDLADDLHDDKESFYDLDQRAIDKYLISFYD